MHMMHKLVAGENPVCYSGREVTTEWKFGNFDIL